MTHDILQSEEELKKFLTTIQWIYLFLWQERIQYATRHLSHAILHFIGWRSLLVYNMQDFFF